MTVTIAAALTVLAAAGTTIALLLVNHDRLTDPIDEPFAPILRSTPKPTDWREHETRAGR